MELEQGSAVTYDRAMPRRKREPRAERAQIPVTASELEKLHEAAGKAGDTLANWARKLLFAEAKRLGIEI